MIVRYLMAALFVALLGVAPPGLAGEPPAMSDLDVIRSHVGKFWTLPKGAHGAGYVVELEIEVADDGTVQSVTIKPPPSPPSPDWAQVALSARRAVLRASPLPLPVGKQRRFKDFVLVFNTKT